MNPYLDDLKRDNEAKHALQAVAVNDFRGAEVAGSDLSSFPEHSLTSPLPDGWHKMLSPTTGKHFFINHELKMKTWEDPRKQGKQAIADNQNSSTTLVKSDQQTEMAAAEAKAKTDAEAKTAAEKEANEEEETMRKEFMDRKRRERQEAEAAAADRERAQAAADEAVIAACYASQLGFASPTKLSRIPEEDDDELQAAAAEAKAAAENAPVHLKMTLGLDFSMTGSEGSDKREKFKRDVTQDLSSASGLPAANFRIRDVSLILDIQVMPDPLAPGMHLWAAKYLGEQAADPSSTLRSVKITSHTTGVDVIPPKCGEVSAAKAEEALNGGSSDTFLQKGEIKRATRSAPVATVSRGAQVLEVDFCSVPIHKDTAEFLEGKDVLVESALEKLLVLHRHVQAQLQDAHARACAAKDVLEAEKAQLLSQIEVPANSCNEHQQSLERIQQQHAQVQAALQSLEIVLQEENLPPQREAGIARQGALEASTAKLCDMRKSGMQQTRLQNQKAGDLSLISSAPLRPFIQAHENSDPVQHLPAGKPDSLCETKQELAESHAESMETPKRSFQASQTTPTPQKCATPRLWGDDQFLVSAKNRLWGSSVALDTKNRLLGSSVALDTEQTLSQPMSRMGLEEEKVTASSRDSATERQSRAELRVRASNRRTVI